MTSLIVFIIASFGLTNLIVREQIFDKPRTFIARIFPNSLLNKGINCETCVGFWIGILLATLCPGFGMHFLIGGLVSSASNKVICILLYKF